jgi:hypothetical protein
VQLACVFANDGDVLQADDLVVVVVLLVDERGQHPGHTDALVADQVLGQVGAQQFVVNFHSQRNDFIHNLLIEFKIYAKMILLRLRKSYP